MTHNRTHRADTVQQEIVDGLRKTGHSVLILSQVGNGCPDLLIARGGTNVLLEVKSKTLDKSPRTWYDFQQRDSWISPMQKIFHNNWYSRIYVVANLQEAITAMNLEIRRK